MHKQHGYYTVDGIDFQSKIQACIFANKHNKNVEWKFNNEAFNTYNWSIEPDASLDQLYDRRAKDLREKYDYLILSYSGGADSHNILMAFIRQNLHIDEIVVNVMEKANSKFTIIDPNNKSNWNAGAEHRLQTVPRLKEIENTIPKTKITVLDLSDFLFNSFIEYGDASWVVDRTEGLNPLNVTRFNYTYFKEVKNQFDKNHKIGLIVGVDKPRTFVVNNELHIAFDDRAANIVPVSDYLVDYTNSSVEFFYWSPDALDMLCKQAHVIKRYIESNPDKKHLWENLTAEKFRLVHERLLRTILYTTWNDSWYQADKATKDWYSEFDDWFARGYAETASFNIWKEGISYVENNAGKFIKYKNGIADGLLNFKYTYKIGRINHHEF